MNQQEVTLPPKKIKVYAKFVMIKVFRPMPSGSDPNVASNFPTESDLVLSIEKAVTAWGQKEMNKMWIVDSKEVVDNRERMLKVCFIVFTGKVIKDPEDRGFTCQGIKYQLKFVDISYSGNSPWIGFEKQFGKANYWAKEAGKWTYEPKGYQEALELLVEAGTIEKKLEIIKDNYSPKQALMFTNQILTNVKTFENAPAQIRQPAHMDPDRCNPHCQFHQDQWNKEKKRIEENVNARVTKLEKELAKYESAEKEPKDHVKDLVYDCFREYYIENELDFPPKKAKVTQDSLSLEPNQALSNTAKKEKAPLVYHIKSAKQDSQVMSHDVSSGAI